MQVDGGLLIRGSLMLSEQQRLSDYLEIAGHFLPLVNAHADGGDDVVWVTGRTGHAADGCVQPGPPYAVRGGGCCR